MIDQDFAAFSREFQRLHAALAGFRIQPSELNAKVDAYFHVLKRLPLHEVSAKADRWLAKETKFPKPAEWASVVHVVAAEIPTLAEAEARAWLDAEQHGWEGQPCHCDRCAAAGLTELQPLRFVPEATRDGQDRHVRIGQRTVTTGHWAHGPELARWYLARGNFWNHVAELGLMDQAQQKKAAKLPFEKRIEAIFAKAHEITEPVQ
jgi:hypothetical protein